MSQNHFTPETTRLDDAARAGWLYYVAGNTQDEIARKLGVSRQTAQRLVAMALAERLGPKTGAGSGRAAPPRIRGVRGERRVA